MSLPTNDKARKALPIWTFLMEYFPDAFLAMVGVAVAGNDQHNPGQPLHWARGKSKDQMNTAFRHMFDYGRGTKKDTDGQWHLAKAIWRLSAQLQLDIEAAGVEVPLELESVQQVIERLGHGETNSQNPQFDSGEGFCITGQTVSYRGRESRAERIESRVGKRNA